MQNYNRDFYAWENLSDAAYLKVIYFSIISCASCLLMSIVVCTIASRILGSNILAPVVQMVKNNRAASIAVVMAVYTVPLSILMKQSNTWFFVVKELG